MLLSKKKEKWAIERRKTLKGVLVGEPINKNKHADVYYRKAMEKEFAKFIASLYKDLEKSYATLKISNARKSPAEVRKVLAWYKTNKFKIFLQNSVKIVEKWLKLAAKEADKSTRDKISKLAGKEITIHYDNTFDEMFKLMIERNVQLICRYHARCFRLSAMPTRSPFSLTSPRACSSATAKRSSNDGGV